MEIGAEVKVRRLRRAHLVAWLGSFVWVMIPGAAVSAQQRDTFSQLAEKAKKASEENRLEEAARLYGRALAIKPKWAEGWWAIGTIEYEQDHYVKAAAAFEKLIALDPQNGTAHAMLGLCQFELHKDEPALKNLMAAEKLGILKDEQLRNVAVYHLGVLLLRAGKFRAAKDTLGQLVKDGIRTKELSTALGLAALQMRPQEAPPEGTTGARVVEQAGKGEVLLAAKDFDGAKRTYSGLANDYPEYPNLHFAFGRLLLGTHEADEAVEEFQRELQRDPKNVNSLLEIAAVRYRLDSTDGVKYAEEAVKLDPQRSFGHYLLGLLYADTQNYAGAILQLEIAKRSHPDLAEIYFALGNAYARTGRKEAAAQARATFARLNARQKRESGDTVYGEQPSGLSEKQLEQPVRPTRPE